MKDNDEDDRKNAMIDKAFATLDTEMKALSEKLDDLNSLYPATKEFLKRCGATHVKELTPEQRIELKAYLTAELEDLLGNKPLN